jgi:GNAT superfamily N-acetyltransferase
MPRYRIASAAFEDVSALAAIELAAAAMLRDHAPASVLAETTPLADLDIACAAGRLWVAYADTAPVGFAFVEMLAPDAPHLEEVDVHPSHGRRGLGTALVRAACVWTTVVGHEAITLTTFRAVPWNAPFYARLGFEELPPAAWSPGLAAVVDGETASGLDPAARVVMRWRPPAS